MLSVMPPRVSDCVLLGEIFMSLPGFTAEVSPSGKTEFYLLRNSGAQGIASADHYITPQFSLPI